MKVSEVAKRYAKAIFDLSVDLKSQDRVFNELREIDLAFEKDLEIGEFMRNPMVSFDQRLKVLKGTFDAKVASGGLSKEVFDLLLMLAENNRFAILHDLVESFQAYSDAAHGVARGNVRSAIAIEPNERQQLEKTVEQVLKKKVILTYKVDPSVIGGLVAQVGSYTFDDSIASHLGRMNEELKRRMV